MADLTPTVTLDQARRVATGFAMMAGPQFNLAWAFSWGHMGSLRHVIDPSPILDYDASDFVPWRLPPRVANHAAVLRLAALVAAAWARRARRQ